MTSLKNLAVAVAVAIAALFAANSAFAAPVSVPPSAIADVVGEHDMKSNVRYGHWKCRYHYIPRWGVKARHRHVGPKGRPVACKKFHGKKFRGKVKRKYLLRRGCSKVGRFWYCP